MNRADFTPTQWKIYEFLADGRPHSREELSRFLQDPATTGAASVRVHVYYVRRAVRRYGMDVVSTRVHSTCYYRLVRAVPAQDA